MKNPLQLCFDIGNTDIHGAVFSGKEMRFEFRKSNRMRPSVDEFGVFLIQLLHTHGVASGDIAEVAAACVVPDSINAVTGACGKYLGRSVLVLEAGVKTGLKIRVQEPKDVGADRIANAMAAVERHPKKNLIVIDTGTATTFCAISARGEYLGGAIAAGLGLSMRALGTQTAKLPLVDLVRPKDCLGKTTTQNIQSGLFFGHAGLIREMVAGLKEEAFRGEKVLVIATGGHAGLFADEGLFDEIVPALVLRGLQRAIALNREVPKTV